jgi:lipopolysaccharide/colanic/teichoic acid biosynthesis glycosyltransferase
MEKETQIVTNRVQTRALRVHAAINQHSADAGPGVWSSGNGTAVLKARQRTDWHEVLRKIQERYGHDEHIPVALRIFECAIAAMALLLTLPVTLILMLVIRRDSPGNPIFRHHRVGRGGKLFRFTKFRTLVADAQQRFPELYAYTYSPQEIEELCFKVPDDPRITRVGRWLRRSTMDELPNFWHVLTGEMALVGPRPEIPEMLPYYTDEELIKYSVRPGITGLPQISGRGRLRFREAAALDIEYVRRRSFRFDVQIMIRTLSLIIRRDGAF